MLSDKIKHLEVLIPVELWKNEDDRLMTSKERMNKIINEVTNLIIPEVEKLELLNSEIQNDLDEMLNHCCTYYELESAIKQLKRNIIEKVEKELKC